MFQLGDRVYATDDADDTRFFGTVVKVYVEAPFEFKHYGEYAGKEPLDGRFFGVALDDELDSLGEWHDTTLASIGEADLVEIPAEEDNRDVVWAVHLTKHQIYSIRSGFPDGSVMQELAIAQSGPFTIEKRDA